MTYPAPNPPPDPLLRDAAELKAEGNGWETVAAKLHADFDAVRRLPDDRPGEWRKVYPAARRAVLGDAFAEAVCVLRVQLRAKDVKVSAKAADVLCKVYMTERRHVLPA